MSQCFLFDEASQLPAKIIRAVIWSGVMSVLWALPFAIALGILLAPMYLPMTSWPSQVLIICGFDTWIYIIMAQGCATIWALITGSLTGIGAALMSDQDQVLWPFRMITFRLFKRRMIPLAILLFILGLLPALYLPWFAIISMVALFAFGVWREVALQRERAA